MTFSLLKSTYSLLIYREIIKSMKHFISAARLNTYKSILKIKNDDEILRAYYWNKALCGSIYPVMQTLEVTLRNALYESVKQHHSGKYLKDDWWFEHMAIDVQNIKIKKMSQNNRNKWLKPDGITRKKQSFAEQAVLGVIRDLKRENRSPILHDDVISRLTFGYWVSTLSRDYEDVTHKKLLWPNLLPHVFSNTPNKPKRLKIEAALKRVKELRNRMSHHEPIWKFYQLDSDGKADYTKPVYGLNTSLNLLEKAYDEVLTIIRWMSEDRYQSFLNGKLDVDFRKLCSRDGFYGFVNPEKIINKITRTQFKREFNKYMTSDLSSEVILITHNNHPSLVLGVNQPRL
jgi:hypothetical protein